MVTCGLGYPVQGFDFGKQVSQHAAVAQGFEESRGVRFVERARQFLPYAFRDQRIEFPRFANLADQIPRLVGDAKSHRCEACGEARNA